MIFIRVLRFNNVLDGLEEFKKASDDSEKFRRTWNNLEEFGMI